MLLSCDSDGGEGRLHLSTGTYTLTAGKASNGLLNGMKGTLVVDSKSGRALTFVPDAVGSSKTVVLASAKATELTDTSGTVYAMKSDTQGVPERRGQQLERGVYLAERRHLPDAVSGCRRQCGTMCSRAAEGPPPRRLLSTRTAPRTALPPWRAALRTTPSTKTASRARAGDMRKYDVATYSPTTNSIRGVRYPSHRLL